jgi:hypothetical protein
LLTMQSRVTKHANKSEKKTTLLIHKITLLIAFHGCK